MLFRARLLQGWMVPVTELGMVMNRLVAILMLVWCGMVTEEGEKMM